MVVDHLAHEGFKKSQVVKALESLAEAKKIHFKANAVKLLSPIARSISLCLQFETASADQATAFCRRSSARLRRSMWRYRRTRNS